MDLSQALWKKLSPSGLCGIIFGLIILLSACTNLPTERLPATQQVLAVETKPDKTEAALKDNSFNCRTYLSYFDS